MSASQNTSGMFAILDGNVGFSATPFTRRIYITVRVCEKLRAGEQHVVETGQSTMVIVDESMFLRVYVRYEEIFRVVQESGRDDDELWREIEERLKSEKMGEEEMKKTKETMWRQMRKYGFGKTRRGEKKVEVRNEQVDLRNPEHILYLQQAQKAKASRKLLRKEEKREGEEAENIMQLMGTSNRDQVLEFVGRFFPN